MGMSFGHLFVVLIIILVVFGAGRLPDVMADIAKGIKAFRDSMEKGNQNNRQSNKKYHQKKKLNK